MNAGNKTTILNYITLLAMVLVSEGFAIILGDEFITAEEVVSIYGPNLITPESRTPYYIKIRRCVINDGVIYRSDPLCWSVPKKNSRQEIEIVVPDINDNTMFYKYVVYNDTACECSISNDASEIAQHKHLESHEVDEIEFKTKEPKNPINLWSCKRSVRSYCDHPQPRYMISPLKNFALPQNKYILYTKCLPGCSRTTNTTKIPDDKFTDKSGSFHPISTVFNDSHCTSSYTAKRRGKREALTDITTPSHNWKEKVSDNTMLQNGMLIYIGSTKLLLVAFVLSLMLLFTFVLDCKLFQRKKGILYSIWCFTKCKAECPNCAERELDRTDAQENIINLQYV